MHPQALLESCTRLLQAVLGWAAPADALVSQFFRAHRELGARDRHVLAETTYAVLRRLPMWRHLAQSGSGPVERRLAALAWQGDDQALQAALTPPEREWLAAVRSVDLQSLSPPLRHHLPAWVADPLLAQLGPDGFWPLVQALVEPAPLDLRVNLHKTRRDEALAALRAHGLSCEATPWSPWGIRVDGKPALQRLALFTDGAVEVQDEGSQLLALLLDAKRGEMVVDFCAGAGGKTLALGVAMRNTGRLYAMDVSGHRLAALKPRLARSGLSNVHPVQIAHERDDRVKRLSGKIDRVLVDAPCSGLGTLRRNPDLKWRQSPAAVRELQAKQAAILASAARLLKPGGRLVYATCSLLSDENEAVAEAFSREQAGRFVAIDAADALQAAHVGEPQALCRDGHLRLWPHRHGCDGFFAAVWQRQ